MSEKVRAIAILSTGGEVLGTEEVAQMYERTWINPQLPEGESAIAPDLHDIVDSLDASTGHRPPCEKLATAVELGVALGGMGYRMGVVEVDEDPHADADVPLSADPHDFKPGRGLEAEIQTEGSCGCIYGVRQDAEEKKEIYITYCDAHAEDEVVEFLDRVADLMMVIPIDFTSSLEHEG